MILTVTSRTLSYLFTNILIYIKLYHSIQRIRHYFFQDFNSHDRPTLKNVLNKNDLQEVVIFLVS